MLKSNLKFLFLPIALSSFFLFAAGQKQVINCKITNNYEYKDYEYEWKTLNNKINHSVNNIETGLWPLNTKERYEATNKKISEYFSELPPPYSIEYETKFTNYLPPNWEQEDAGYYEKLTIKKPFNTYIDEQKNFDIMFCLRELNTGKKQIIIVVKNYYTNYQYNSLTSATFVIDDYQFFFTQSLPSLGSKYRNQLLPIKSGVNIIAYRDVVQHILSFDAANITNLSQEDFVADIISKVKPGKVFITYETSTGQIKRTLTEAQVKSLKEMLQIYEKFQFDKWDITYLNEQVKKDCQEMEAQIQKANEPHYIKLQPIIDRINEVMEKYKKF